MLSREHPYQNNMDDKCESLDLGKLKIFLLWLQKTSFCIVHDVSDLKKPRSQKTYAWGIPREKYWGASGSACETIQDMGKNSVAEPILQGGAPKIAKLVYNSHNYGLWYLYCNYSYGSYKPTYNWGAPPCGEPWKLRNFGSTTRRPPAPDGLQAS